MIYLIGGPARCGKSTLARQLRKRIEGQIISGDAVVYSLKAYINEEWVPEIFTETVNPVHRLASHEAQHQRLRERDIAVWPFYEKYIEAVLHDTPSEDVLIDGNLWPDLTRTLGKEHRAVFLVDTSSPDIQAKKLISMRDSPATDNNWMRDWTDERIGEWAQFNLLRSEMYIKQCDQYDCTYFDTSIGFQQAQDAAIEYLLSKRV